MESKVDRKAAIKAFKEWKPQLGVYAVRCPSISRVWVGSSRNLDAARNLLRFSLGSGGADPAMQAEWNARGESAVVFEVLEKLPDDVSPLVVYDLLKEKKRDWIARLSACAL